MLNQKNRELLERVRTAKRYYRITVTQIANQAGMAVSTAQNQLFGKYKLDIDLIVAVLELCPDLSADWLMSNKGNMIVQKSEYTELLHRIERLEQKNSVQ